MNRGNICQTDSSSSNENGRRNDYQSNPGNPLSDICKYLEIPPNKKASSKENVELALEVEINESLKEVLARHSSGSSDLLDVTIIRPSESDTTHETTVALNKDEVRDFITLVEQHHRNKKSETRNRSRERRLNDDNDIRQKTHCAHNKNATYRTPSKSSPSSNYSSKDGSKLHSLNDGAHGNHPGPHRISNDQKQVYATANTFDKLKSTLKCQKKDKSNNQKPGTPCLCQHCGIVGVLVQSQKGPVATFPPIDEEETSEDLHSRRRPKSRNGKLRSARTVSPKETRPKKTIDLRRHGSIDQMELLREINARIKILEKRISVQEQTAVPRDYLKHILHKILTQYNFRSSSHMSRDNSASTPSTRMKNSATQYSSKSIPQKEIKFQCGHRHQYDTESGRDKTRNFHVHTCLHSPNNQCIFKSDNSKQEDGIGTSHQENISITAQQKSPAESEKERDVTEKQQQKELCWFWGEEIVKPGCDLRNKILSLLEDKIHRNTNGKVGENTVPNKHQFNNYPKKLEDTSQKGIKIECDNNTIYLNEVEEISPYKTYEYIKQNEPPRSYLKQEMKIPEKKIENARPKSPVSNDKRKPNSNDRERLNRLIHVFPARGGGYPFDVKKTIDDTIFRRNIEAYKEKLKEKPQAQIEEKYFNNYACHSISTESKASMEYIAQKVKNCQALESGLSREQEEFINAKFMLPPYESVRGSYIKEKLNTCAFRSSKNKKSEKVINFTYVNPKIHNWSEESSLSDDKMQAARRGHSENYRHVKSLEEKESLIYKLDFLKNLAKNKSIDQSRVLNRIWNQAKHTARSSKDAVLIKIPIKTINTCNPNNNVVEMELTLEELETVVKTAKNPPKDQVPIKIGYKSSSDVDIAQRRHQEMRQTNREIVNRRRQTSAKSKFQC